MKAYTDYPLFPEEEGKLAPVREIEIISYDLDKYVIVEFDNRFFEIKAGYLYKNEGRYREVERVSIEDLHKLTEGR